METGGVTLSLGQNATYTAKDLVIHRKYLGLHDENLVKWSRQESKGKEAKAEEDELQERLLKDYLVWMRRDEMEACCPHLVGLEAAKMAPTAPPAMGEPVQKQAETEGDESLLEMAEDINSLVTRSQRLMHKAGQKPGGVGGKMLSNTISILSAYARIGALANTFRESGALDLLLTLLSSQDIDVRRSASDMLRSLATYDTASRAYVLLQLTREESASVQSRNMLLDLFAETTSGEEDPLLSGITLPQVPGRFVFSVLKKYLRVSSIARNDTVTAPLPEISGHQLEVPVPSEFELFYATHQLISELFTIFSWYEGTLDKEVQEGSKSKRVFKGLSIFTGTSPRGGIAATPKKKKKNPYKTREDFSSDRYVTPPGIKHVARNKEEYGQYVKGTLTAGMRVRARVNYESVSEGDYGIYRQTNDGTPPAQFAWDGLGADTYWVFWHQVEILPPASDAENEDASLQRGALKQPYVMRSLTMGGGVGVVAKKDGSHEPVNHDAFWWEVLCLLKTLPLPHVEAVVALFGTPALKSFDDLIHITPTYSQVADVVHYLETAFPHLSQEPLSIKEMSQFRAVYQEVSVPTIPAKEETSDSGDDLLDSRYKKEQPYPDPYEEEEPLRPLLPHELPGFDDPELSELSLLRTLSGLLRHRREEADPTMHLRSLEHCQDGSLSQLMAVKRVIEKYLEKYPTSCRIAVHSLRALKSGIEVMESESDRSECCISGFFTLFLRLMHIAPTSCMLQCWGLDCFFQLMGGFGVHDTLPLPPNESRPEPMSDSTRSLILATVLSLASATEYGGLKSIVDAILCAVEYYHTQMGAGHKKNAVISVRHGLYVLAALLTDCDTQKKMEGWGIPKLLESINKKFPGFATKKELCSRIAAAVPGYIDISGDVSSDDLLSRNEAIKALTKEIMSVIKTLRKSDDIYSRNPLPRLLRLMDRDITSSDPFVKPPASLTSIFLLHQGIFYLTLAMEANRSSTFTENALVLIGSLVLAGEEEASQVVLQGGLRAITSCVIAYPGNKQIQRLCLRILVMLSRDPDNVVIMSSENISPSLRNTRDKYSSDDEICRNVAELLELCEGGESSRAALHQKILGIIFSAVLETLLNSIEEARRTRQLVNMPKFSAFVKYLSAGSGGTVNLGKRNQCFEKLEVSSNTHRKDRMLDGDPGTYWESSGRSGSHWIRLYMRKGLVIKKLCMEVNCQDAATMPQRVTIQGGPTADNVQDISTVFIPNGFTGPFELVTSAKKHYPVVVIRIKRCQQGGIDTRVRNITCEAARASLWPIFGDLFSARTKLFYHIQVQTWLKDSTLGPLELFDRLSAVVLHEQHFADYFLVTVPSRQCLGQACRSALITPLIDTLTQTVGDGGPNLQALLHDYISQMQPPMLSQWRALAAMTEHERDGEPMSYEREFFDYPKAHQRLVQMSRIRRMCRLLVDCDSNTTSKEELKEVEEGEGEGKQQAPAVKTGEGTVAMARCWRDIVQSEVTQVLHKFDYPRESPHVVAAEVLGIYDQLKQAMLELFGGHSQFALALKAGFSKAFQTLDEVTGVRFCELLCLCIDSLMDSAGKDTLRFQHLSEHQREILLLHLAEPLQFLHTLDIAHVFEHYYRRHLAARLLRGRTHSVPLERRMVQTFAHCFPHKHPLQMLQDLEDSSILLDRFCDSELLESLDQLMVQASSPQMLTPDILSMAQKCMFYRQRTLQVYILNPAFWPLKQRSMPPSSSLPHPLNIFCEDFQRFFTVVHEFGLQQHERARRLYWTLHGWASLAHCGLKLVVSTIQMILLLQFNSAEMHSLRSLQEATQLGYQELCDALLALTAERQCLLLSQSPRSQEGLPAMEEDPALQNSPFKLNTTFTINEAFPADVARKQKSNKVRFHDVRLVSRSHTSLPLPSREERSVDLAHMFERRRAIIDAAVVRLLKREKEMSMDNITVKVIKGCSVGRFERGALFGRFDCDFRDVCSRIDRLIMDGYIRRHETKQQMLIYIPDPTAGKEEETQEISEPLKEAEDQEPPEPPRSNEVGAPKDKPSEEIPVSKLLPRKRPGPSRPVLTKTKRKPQQFTRMYSNEMYERDEAPLLGMLPTSKSLTVEAVQVEINSLLVTIAQVLKVEKDVLEHLLHHCNWNKDTVIQRYLNNPDSLLEEAGLMSKGAPPPSPPEQVSCPVCLLSMPRQESTWLWCGHACCKTCWEQHYRAQIDMHRILLCSCPLSGCHARPTRSFLLSLFGEDSGTISKFSKAVVRSYVEQSGRLTWCQNPQGCDQVLCRGDGMNTGTCHKCHWSSCFSCHYIEAHQPANCQDMARWVENGGFYEGMDEDARSKQLANLIAKRCPGCNAQIEKNEGCLHMKCKCGHSFCWKCMKSWRPTHTDFYNCTAKISKAAEDHKKFADYNQRCTSHHRSKMFAEKLCLLVKGIGETVPMKILSFISDACDLLVQCHKMLSYACIAEYYSKLDSSAYLSFLCENFEGDTNALQAFLENTLLSVSDMAHAIRTLPERRLLDGYRLVSKIENTRDKLLLGFHQHFKLGDMPTLGTVSEEAEESKEKEEDVPHLSLDEDEDGYDDEEEEDYDDEDELSYIYSDYDDELHAYDSDDSDIFPF